MARERGGDLVLVLEGQVTRAQVAEAGRNIIARGLKFSRRLPPGVTLSFQVAAVCAPLPDTDAAVLLGLLDRAIQEIAADPLGRKLRILAPAESAEASEDAAREHADGRATRVKAAMHAALRVVPGLPWLQRRADRQLASEVNNKRPFQPG